MVTQAQVHEPCGSAHYLEHLEQNYPGFQALADAPFVRARNQEGTARNLTVLTVPVVVHIVYQNEDQNLSDETIDSVLAVLNLDFRRLNPDTVETRADFLDVVADPHIEFELVGIERVETDATFELDLFGGGLPDNVKRASDGGSDAWDTQRYLNIWVCNVEGGALLGYAYPPADLVNWPDGASAPSPELDGVVIHHEVFRTTGTYSTGGLFGGPPMTIPIRGRTITHEVGHYLGLRHIWGDGTLSILGIPDCEADDGVADTPNQGLNSQFACDPTANTCNEGPDDQVDMWENFMDYAQETCLNSFTQGQVTIMRDVLLNERFGLIENSVNTEEPLALADVKVYPNPANQELVIAQADATETLEHIQLYNAHGQLVQAWASPNHHFVVPVQSLAKGTYFLRLTHRTGVGVRTVVIQ